VENVQSVPSDEAVEKILGYLLRTGVLLAAGIVLAGGFLYVGRHKNEAPDYRLFHSESVALRDIPRIIRDAVSLDERSIIQMGILILIATPVVRVAFSVYVFLRDRDFIYVLVTLIVLTLVLYGIMDG